MASSRTKTNPAPSIPVEPPNLEETSAPVGRALPAIFPLTWETVLLAGLAVLALFSRLWELGARVMSHDESLHVYYSWLLANRQGYAHNPMMHGPWLFESTALMNVLFGASDFTSRLVPVILGLFAALVVPQLLKRWLGRSGALAVSALLVISPFILYFSRYIRHDIQVIAWMLLAVVAIFRYLENRNFDDLILLAAALGLMVSTMEITFFYLAILAVFLAIRLFAQSGFNWGRIRASAELDLLVVLGTLGAFFSSPIALIVLNPIWSRLTGAPFVDLKVLDTQGVEWANGPAGPQLWGLLIAFSIAAVAIGLLWDYRRWWKLAAVFGLVTVSLFTTFFSNWKGIGTGFVGSLGYWLSQQGVARGSQPDYYYLIVFPLYEYLPLLGGILAAAYFTIKQKSLDAASKAIVPFLIWWALSIFVALSLAGEKMPWLSTHITIPFILLTGWWAGQLIDMRQPDRGAARRPAALLRGAALSGLALLALLTVRTSIMANYINYDLTTEYIDYAHGAPGVKWTTNDIAVIGSQTGEGHDLKVAYDSDVSWPMTWYLRNYTNQAFFGAQPNREALNAPVIVAGPNTWTKVEAIVQNNYRRFEVIRLWWPIEDYKNLTWERIRYALTNPEMRAAIWDILWNRDYTRYGELTGQRLDPPTAWPLGEKMRIYVQRDIPVETLSLSQKGTLMAELPPVVDAYAGLNRSVPAEKLLTPGLNAPRNLALAPDGSIYVADTANSRIVHMDASGQVLNTWGSRTPDGQTPPAPGTFIEPWGIVLDAQGNVYVADTWNHRIQKFAPDGTFLLQWGVPGVAADGLDKLWGPRAIAIGADGRIYVTDTGNKRVLAFDASGQALFEFSAGNDGLLNEPVGLAVGPDGNVYVADTWNMRVAMFSPDGQFQQSWPVQGWASDSLENKPYLAIDSQGRVYVTDPEGYRVVVFTASGQPLAVFGQYGPEDNSFGLPNGIAVDSTGKIWVADAGNNRIGIYDVWGK